MQLEEGMAGIETALCAYMIRFSGDRHLAEDAVQHAYLQGLLNRNLLEGMPVKAFKAWIYATARNYILDQHRRKSRWVLSDPDVTRADESDLEAEVIRQVMVEKAVASLDSGQQAVVRMRYYQDMNATQIGEVLGIPASTVRSRLRKAMGQMRKNLEETA